MKKPLFLSCLGLLLVAMAGCSSAAKRREAPAEFSNAVAGFASTTMTNRLNPDWLRPPSNFFTLGPGDKLEIEILGTANSRAVTPVGPDGKIYYHLLPGLDVWGLTLTETRTLLERQLTKYLSEPQVTVTLREVASMRVWLLGRLNRPGIYPLTAPMTLLESLALAGGTARSSSQVTTEELADLRHSFVMRQGQLLPVDFYRLLREGDTSQNIYLQPDDFVYVPSALAQEVYIMGAVRFPRTVGYTERMTLVSAMANASGAMKVDWLSQNAGLAPDAYLSHVAIVRGSLSQPQLMVVDFNAIVKGRIPDVPLEAGDIIYVPNAPYATLKRYFNTIVNTFVATVAVNEGARAGGIQTVGVSVPVGH